MAAGGSKTIKNGGKFYVDSETEIQHQLILKRSIITVMLQLNHHHLIYNLPHSEIQIEIPLIQQSFEQLNPKCVAVVVDPIQSVRGKVVIDAFRLINPIMGMSGGH